MPTVRRCCIIGCTSNSREKPQLQFFQFPKSEHPLHKLWMQACQASLNRILPFKKPVVCALHFDPKNIGGRRLTGSAIPCLQLDVPSNIRALEQQTFTHEIERTRKYLFLNAVVYEWLVRSNLNPHIRGSVTHGMIKEKAELAKNIIGLDSFVADNRWLNSFRETQLKGFAAKLASNQLETQGGSSLFIADIIKDLEHLYPPANTDHMENVPEQYLNYIQQYGEYDDDDDVEKDRKIMQSHIMNSTSMQNFNGLAYNTASQMQQDYSYNSIYNNTNISSNMYSSNASYNSYGNNNNSNYNQNNSIYNALGNYNNLGYNNNSNANYMSYQQQQQQQHQQQQSHSAYFNALSQKYTVTSAGFEAHSDSNYSSPQYSSNTSQSPPAAAATTTNSQAQPAKRAKLDIKATTPASMSQTPVETFYIEDDDVQFVEETKPRTKTPNTAQQQQASETSANETSTKAQDIISSVPKSKFVDMENKRQEHSSTSPNSVNSKSPQPQAKTSTILRLKSALQENNNFSPAPHVRLETEKENSANKISKSKKLTALPNLKTLHSYEEALAYLKPLEDFVLIMENFRAIGLLSQFEVILRRGVAAKSTERAKHAAEDL